MEEIQSKANWGQSKILMFIRDYKRSSILWDPSIKENNARSAKKEALVRLSEKYCVGVNTIRRKIRNLRQTMRRELRKIRSEKIKGITYKPKWYAFEAMHFVAEANDSDFVLKTEGEKKPLIRLNKENSLKRPRSDEDHEVPHKLLKIAELTVDLTEEDSNPIASSTSVDPLPNFETPTWSQQDRDEHSVFGEYVGLTIRNLNNDTSKIVVKHFINTLLFEAKMGKYDNGIFTSEEPPDLYQTIS
ncbi:hypothetical protein ACFFRR_004773 [Megaselia abdita]